ncbi:hypothetical protein BH24ACT21_BH24ACT21_07580 [soil metagenome]|jgi:hypothetical protein
MVEQQTEKTLRAAQELNEFYNRLWGINDRSIRISDDQPKPKLPLISKGSDPKLAKHFEYKLNDA